MNRTRTIFWLCTTITYVYLPWQMTNAVVIFTYTNPEAAALNAATFSPSVNAVGDIPTLTKQRDRFSTAGPFATDPTAQSPQAAQKQLPDIDSRNYQQLFNKTVSESSNKKEFSDIFNLYSRASFQLSYLPSDVTIVTEVFQTDPQLNSIIDYYANGIKIEPGQHLILYEQSIAFEIVRKESVGFGGQLSQQPTVYTIACPPDRRVTFDVTEIEQLPTYHITSRTKGCNITISQLPSMFAAA